MLTKTVITISDIPDGDKRSIDHDHSKLISEQDKKHSGEQDQASPAPDIPMTSTNKEEDSGSTLVDKADESSEEASTVEMVSTYYTAQKR